MNRWVKFLLFVPLCLGLQGCSGLAGGHGGGTSAPLVVGVKADFPPVIFKQGSAIVGAEADLARMIANYLGRPLRFVEMGWDQSIDALARGEVDLVMSGMTVTEARKMRIDFTDPYLQVGLMPLVRRKEAAQYADWNKMVRASVSIGVQKDSTADVFVQGNCPRARRVAYLQPADAALDLSRNTRIDIYIDDAPSIWWQAAQNEATLVAIPLFLTKEDVAWGVSKNNGELRDEVNRMLAGWMRDGTLQSVLKRWIPLAP